RKLAMVKLLTPVQYEGSLDELNKVRPLALADEVKRDLGLCILNVEPAAANNRLARGKFLRCDSNGSLLKHNSKSYDNFELVKVLVHDHEYKAITFSQVVHKVSIKCFPFDGQAGFNWVSSIGTWYQSLAYDASFTAVDFRGTTMYVSGDGFGAS
ncbi:unnamed protein product, partial [marine sediment metagenome]